jgi:DNA uptake protein ComE-like DNA-binding protein
MLFKCEEKASLKVREWLAVAIIAGIIGGLACLTSFKGRGEAGKIHSLLIPKQDIGFDVLIKGAVEHPGIYHIHSEIKLKDLLAMAGVSLNADLRRFSPDTMVKKGRIINVPSRAMIKVHLRGAVAEEMILSVPKNSKLADLIDIGNFSPEADLAFLKKKRRLKDGEVIQVPAIP